MCLGILSNYSPKKEEIEFIFSFMKMHAEGCFGLSPLMYGQPEQGSTVMAVRDQNGFSDSSSGTESVTEGEAPSKQRSSYSIDAILGLTQPEHSREEHSLISGYKSDVPARSPPVLTSRKY